MCDERNIIVIGRVVYLFNLYYTVFYTKNRKIELIFFNKEYFTRRLGMHDSALPWKQKYEKSETLLLHKHVLMIFLNKKSKRSRYDPPIENLSCSN